MNLFFKYHEDELTSNKIMYLTNSLAEYFNIKRGGWDSEDSEQLNDGLWLGRIWDITKEGKVLNRSREGTYSISLGYEEEDGFDFIVLFAHILL